MGTIDYVSPEQARGEGATPRSDVYQLAGVLCECLSGTVPYDRPTEAAVLFAHLTEPPPSLAERRPDLPAAISDVIARGMAKDPAERYESPGELMSEARRALGVEVAGRTS
jgi:serine/threonine kinase PknH